MIRKYDTVDLLKFIGSILVFTMHLSLFMDTDIDLAIQISARWCVPFFFIISSFFLFKNSDKGRISAERLSGYVKRILFLYIAWFIVNIPSIIYTRIITKGIFSFATYLNFIKGALLTSTFTGSWYLMGSVFSAVLIYLLSKRFSNRFILLFTFPLYLVCVATSVYGNILPKAVSAILMNTLCFPLNIFGGCFYFAVGKHLADNYVKFKGLSKFKAFLFFAVSFAAYCVEVILAKRTNLLSTTDFAFSSVLYGFAFVLFGITLNINIKNGIVLRKASTIIYCAQGNVILLSNVIKKGLNIQNDILRYILILFLMSGIVAFVLILQKKSKWKFVKYLT